MYNYYNKELNYKIKQRGKKFQKHTARNRLYKYNYGIDLEEYNKMFQEQEGCCAICKTHQTCLKKRLAVDHCHQENKVRKLLCQNCNLGLGLFKEDVNILKEAIKYLEGSQEPLGRSLVSLNGKDEDMYLG